MRGLNRALVLLTALAVIQLCLVGYDKLSLRRAHEVTPLAIGENIDMPVVSDSTGATSALSDVKPGTCRYIVIASLTCPYSKALAARWIVTALNDPRGMSMPKGWETFWVIGESQSGVGNFFESDFPVPTYHSLRGFDDFRRSGVVGVPFHIVLDSEGRVRSGGLGAELLPRAAFQEDCAISPDERVQSPTTRLDTDV